MYRPEHYTAMQIKEWGTDTETLLGWQPARPISGPGIGFWHRLKLAFAVFTGKADALFWWPPED